MIWQAPENKALGISVIKTRDSCDSCTSSEGVVTEEGKKKKIIIINLPLSFSTEHVHI